MARQTVVIVVPTCYEDPDQARRAVEPYVRDMRVVAKIIDVRDEDSIDGERIDGRFEKGSRVVSGVRGALAPPIPKTRSSC